jgi:hypothetical protein
MPGDASFFLQGVSVREFQNKNFHISELEKYFEGATILLIYP